MTLLLGDISRCSHHNLTETISHIISNSLPEPRSIQKLIYVNRLFIFVQKQLLKSSAFFFRLHPNISISAEPASIDSLAKYIFFLNLQWILCRYRFKDRYKDVVLLCIRCISIPQRKEAFNIFIFVSKRKRKLSLVYFLWER